MSLYQIVPPDFYSAPTVAAPPSSRRAACSAPPDRKSTSRSTTTFYVLAALAFVLGTAIAIIGATYPASTGSRSAQPALAEVVDVELAPSR